jgi:translation elongation factor EF-Tu-like GTPase
MGTIESGMNDKILARFKLEFAFSIIDRGFFLVGKLLEGEVRQGNYIDLTPIGLNCKPTIERIEFALKRQDGKAWEDFALGTRELTNEQQAYIKKVGSFALPFDILNEK